MSITGESLPTDTIESVEFAGTECDTTTIVSDGSSVTCDLLFNPAAGDWSVSILDDKGVSLIAVETTAISVPLQVDSVSPSSDLNQNGGDTLTFAGLGFPLNTNDITVTFSDGTSCTVTSSTDV